MDFSGIAFDPFGNNSYIAKKYGVQRPADPFRADWNISDKSTSAINPKTIEAGQSLVSGVSALSTDITNASLIKDAARVMDVQGELAATRSRAESSKALGAQVTGTAAAGIQMTGSALEALRQSQYESEFDAFMKKQAYLNKANEMKIEASQKRASGVSSLFSGLGKAAFSMRTP